MMANRWKFDHRKANLPDRRWRDIIETEKKPKTSNEIIGAIKLWINTEIPSSLVNRLIITSGFGGETVKIRNQPEFSDAPRSMTIYFTDDHLHISKDFGDGSIDLPYCDPKLFDDLFLLISRVHNG